MDVTPFLDLKCAPRALFDTLDQRRDEPRYKVRISGGFRTITRGEHADEIEKIARFIDQRGLKKGDRVAIFSPNRVEWMTAALGAQSAGMVMVPIYPSSTADQASYIVDHSDAKVVFVDTTPLLAKILEAWSAYDAVDQIVVMDDAVDLTGAVSLLEAKALAAPPFSELERKICSWSKAIGIGAEAKKTAPDRFEAMLDAVGLQDVGVMLYTSGTSGPPKGVPLTHENVGVNGRDWLVANAPLLDEGLTDVLWLPMSHIFGFGEACLGNTLGFVSYLSSPIDALNDLSSIKPQVFMSVPAYWEKIATAAMLESDPDKRKEVFNRVTGGNLRFCLSGGAGLKREIKDLFHELGVLIIEGYGLTEASPTLTLNRPDAFRFDSVGKPLDSVQLRLADDGEILAKGPSIFSGYHKDPAATAEAFTEDGWLKTGDIGELTEDGFLKIVDRKKDILVTAGGKNVPPANIELKFKDDSLISHVVVYGDAKKYVVALVWLFPEAAKAQGDWSKLRPLVEERIQKTNSQLASCETIKRFDIVDEPLSIESGLLTPTMKVRRKKVYERYRDRFEGLYA